MPFLVTKRLVVWVSVPQSEPALKVKAYEFVQIRITY